MNVGELLTRLTIWITIVAFAVGFATFALSRNRRSWDAAARLAWTVACIALLAHVAFAYHFYHGWSQDAAYLETARQTEKVVGLNWGGGLYINYALVIGWVVDTICWWVLGLEVYRSRSWPLVAAWRGFLIFIIFNATVVFKTGFVRWAGLFVCVALGLTWLIGARDNLAGDVRSFARD
ncbi:MAG TPA: hypothetical protein VGC61_03885 [Pyrinomonadaceae bacterium]|jgi:hypothetical protein